MNDDKMFEAFVSGYVKCALWVSELDDKPVELAPETKALMGAECLACWVRVHPWIETEREASQAGHDFWLDRRGEGAGALDGHWREWVAEKLHSEAQSFGNAYLFDVDGVVYQELG